MITLQGFGKDYGDFTAVESIDLHIAAGETFGFIGPNGAGKSTTLKMITGYLAPTSGNVFVDGKNIIDDCIEIQKEIGYLPELNPLYTEMKVHEYLKFNAEIRHIVGDDFKEALTRVVSECGLQGVVHKTIGNCSKGYKQRIGLAAAMIHDPKILILDEPVTGLDPNQIVEIRELIKRVGKKKLVLMSSHILQEIQATVDRIIIINNEISRLPNKLFDKMIQKFYRFSLIFGITKNVEITNVRYEDSLELTWHRTQLVATFTAHSSPF